MTTRMRMVGIEGDLGVFAPVLAQLPEHAAGMPKDENGNDTFPPGFDHDLHRDDRFHVPLAGHEFEMGNEYDIDLGEAVMV